MATRTHNTDNLLEYLEVSLGTAMQHGGLILKAEMQRLAPLDTGRMTRSVSVSAPTRTPEGIVVSVGPTVDYAKYTELEPWIIGKRPGPKSQIKGASIPWMRPAADNVRDDILETIANGVRTAVKAALL